jgi:putative protein kinase ArgK-like GTPase of G3E family
MKKIIDRYAEGLSSLAEEQLLREWSAAPQTDEPQELAWAQLMRGISQAKESEPQQLWAPPVSTIPRFQRFKYTAIAASVALVLGTTVFTGHRQYQKRQAQIAYEQTLAAFELVSEQMQKANKSIAYLETYEQTKNKLFK